MFSQLRFLRPKIRQVPTVPLHRFKSNWVDGGDHSTHNDLPVPEGDWKDDYQRKNTRNNIILVTGVAALSAVLGAVFFSDFVTFNWAPPKHWKEDSAGCECD